MNNVFVGLLSSRKAVVTLVVILASFVALYLGRASWDQIDSLLKVILPSWLGAVTIEDVASKQAAAKVEVAKSNSIPPPAGGQ